MTNAQILTNSTRTVQDILPVHEHPSAHAIRGIWRVARAQMRELKREFKDSNDKARYIKHNLTPEQLYLYEWISYMYTIIALPMDGFARQIGCKKPTVAMWLNRRGHFPAGRFMKRLLDFYDSNFCDQQAVELLHGAKIGQWRAKNPNRPGMRAF